jgi:putative spermidine/putrescine transport system substrate-binding protein
MKLLAYVTQADPQARIAQASWYGPINPQAFKHIPASVRPDLSGSHQASKLGTPINWRWWSQNYDAVNAKFTSWLNS